MRSNVKAQDFDREDPERLSALLKRCRARIRPERPSLGPYLRPPKRIGKAVTQEDIAEAVGITRQWYERLENDRAARVSSIVLGRIADALMMDSAERSALFRFAVPEMRATSLADRSSAILEAFRSVRSIVRPLLAATTEAEALTVVRERAMAYLAPDAMATFTRLGEGRWDHDAIGDPKEGPRLGEFQEMVSERWGREVLDDLHCYTLMTQPGDLITSPERDARFPGLGSKARAVHDAVGWPDGVSCAMANVRSQGGFVGRILAIHTTRNPISEVERAQLSTLADLTSLALSTSGSPSQR
ncbi:MAG TPA: helix-turn-helix transcriptional regulator [Candidatus Acidoferrum sp.]|nr:helix-turn-helix transcriptional regulator [Candidatus Acidoferrum sp.]